MSAQSQIDFKLYFANNVGDVSHVTKLKDADSELTWKEIAEGTIASNRNEMEPVKQMFAETRQKNRADQELFWKMRDDNLLCFRINDGKGTSGEFEARARLGSGRGSIKKNVSNYFFVNTDNHSDSLFITVNRKGCSKSPADTLHFKYYVYDWGNEDLMLFKLDSRRRNSGLTYQIEYVLENSTGSIVESKTLDLKGNSFQSFYRPEDRDVKEIFLVSNGNRLKLDQKRLMWGANLSDKLNRLWMNTNFTLDKHKNRELTIFNMLGSGLFEQYDTLYLQVMGKSGPIKVDVDPQTKLAKGFSFNIAEVDGDGKYKKTDGLQMKYVGYNPKTGTHKILTYGNPCYMEVYAPGYYPALYKFAGARDPKTRELNQERTNGTLRLIAGTTTATGPDISSHFLSALKDEKKLQEYNGKLHKVFSTQDYDMGTLPTSGFYSFIEDGGCQEDPKLLNGKPIEKYAQIAIDYSMSKSGNTAGNVAVLKFEESGSTAEPVKVDPSSTVTLNGNDYPGFQRSWYSLRWDLVGKLANKDVNYKPRLTIGTKVYNELPFVRRLEFNEKKTKEEARQKAEEYCFKQNDGMEYNGWGSLSIFGSLVKFDIKPTTFPGLSFSVVPYLEPVKGIFEVDVNLSIARGRDDNNGKMWRDNLKEKGKSSRFKLSEVKGDNDAIGFDALQSGKTSKLDKDHWAQAEMDDIFKVEANKLGGGLFFDGYLGFGIQMYDHRITGQPSNHGFYLKGAEVGLGYGYFLAYNFDLLEKWKSTWKFFNIRAYINLVAQIQGRLGFKSYNFKRNGTFNTKYGFFFQAMLQGKAGAGINLMETDFAHGDENNPNPGEGQIIDDGNDEGDIIPAAPARRANKASRGTWLNRLFSAAIGVRGGGKAQAAFGFTSIFNDDDHSHDVGVSAFALAGIELYADIKFGPFIRYNPRIMWRGSVFWAYPDNEHNPTIPLYPNYLPASSNAPAQSFWRAPSVAAPAFVLGKCVMDGLNYQARPFFMGDNNFVMVNNGSGTDVNEERLTDYDVPTTDDKMDKNDGLDLSEEGRWVQNHSCAKEGPNEMIVYEEMTREINNEQVQAEVDVEKDLEQTRHVQIASLLKSETTGIWKHHVVAYDENTHDSSPVVAINVYTEDGATAIPGAEDQAACVWKRGQYVMPTYEEVEGATEEENQQRKQEIETSGVRAFEGDVMLSIFDQDKWGAPESVVKLDKDDVLSDYQVLMCNDTVLIALAVLPKDRDSLELRYYSKPYGEPVKYIATDKTNPVRFSLDLVGAMPTIAILNQVDSANRDIYVKHIDMKGRYKGYGTDLSIARYNPESVKIITDKKNERPEDFAIVWKCADRAFRREGKYIPTDSTQTMLNCSRIYMRENMTVTPYVTLGCTADSTYMSGYDVIMEDMQLKTLYTLTDLRDGNTYLMKDAVQLNNDFSYSIGYSQEAMIDTDVMPINLTVYNTGATPITLLEGFINDEEFVFEDVFINPYTSQTLTVEFQIPENFDGLLRAHDVVAIFEDTWGIAKSSRRGAPLRRSVKAEEDVCKYASGTSDVRCELLSQTIEGTVNKVYLELTDFDGLNDNETVHVGLYPSHIADVPICSTAEVLLKANDFSLIGNDRKAYVELTVDGLEEPEDVEIRARVYNDKVLEAMGEDDDFSDAIVDNLSWQDNQRIITLLPSEIDNVTLLPVVKRDDIQHKVKIEQTRQGVWISGLEQDDFVRIFDAAGLPYYQNSHPTDRLFVPIHEHAVYLLSTGQEIVKFTF